METTVKQVIIRIIKHGVCMIVLLILSGCRDDVCIEYRRSQGLKKKKKKKVTYLRV